MNLTTFITKWKASTLKEIAYYQEHFKDLCALVKFDLDAVGGAAVFQKHVGKLHGGKGYADVSVPGRFAIEYKGPGKNLDEAYKQLQLYRDALGNPPLLVVSDSQVIRIHTNFTGTVPDIYTLTLDASAHDPSKKILHLESQEGHRVLTAMFQRPAELKPGFTVALVSEQAARQVASLARSLEGRGIEAMVAARFLMKVVFALFAEDAELLPEKLVENILKQARKKPETAKVHLEKLFAAMRDGDESGVKFTAEIAHFNGGLFEDTSSLDLEADDLDILLAAAKLDWSSVDPAIFGNLYEYGLGAESRAKRGVHYTSREDILHLIEPVLLRPWRQRWETLREEVVKGLEGKASGKALGILKQRVEAFREALGQVQVLDPACGSGNFLVVAMQRLMDLELEVVRFQAARFHIQALSFHVGPQQLHGIELLAFPHALASVVVWIGHLQWLHQHRYSIQERPILKKLQPIVQGDSLLLDWPKVDAIIGNPPFIGSKRLRSALGDATVDNLFKDWDGRVPREADYVCYWFEKAREAVVAGRAERVGLLATNSLRQGKNRVVVDRILADTSIFFAESDRDWTLKGAAVRVSMVGFGAMEAGELRVLDGQVVETINPNLTSASDFSRAKRLKENAGLSFMGDTKGAPFDIPGDLARDWLAAPSNPNGRPNSDVLKPWANGMDITRRPQDRWIIDFGMGALKAGQAPVPGMLHLPEAELCYYVEPYNYAMSRVKPAWAASKTGSRREWFVHAESRPALRGSIAALPRFLVTTRHAKHRIFEWLPGGTIPDSALIAFATDQDGFFGVLQSRVHDLWAVAQGSFLGVGNDSRYTPNTTFETFPFPSGFHVSPPDALALAARRLHEKRGAWLNPAGADSVTLASRTLTALYNSREAGQAKATWLNDLHRELDRSVLAAYGWSDLAEPLFQAEDALRAANPNGEALGLPLTRTPAGQAILGRLLELNQARVSK